MKHPLLSVLVVSAFVSNACVTDPKRETAAPDSIAITLRHLDRLGELVTQNGVTYR